MRPHLLIVEDDPDILDLLSTGLSLAGFEVTAVATGEEALAGARWGMHDLVVIDVILPDLDGFEVVRRLRREGVRTPVLFLTARDSVGDKIEGLALGGDDYVTKPFDLGEVRARIRAVLRRTAEAPRGVTRLTYAGLDVDVDNREVRQGGRHLALSPTEFKLLCLFVRNPGRALSKAEILAQVWEYDFGGDAGIVESYVSSLRRKLDGSLIHTQRGVGYVLRADS